MLNIITPISIALTLWLLNVVSTPALAASNQTLSEYQVKVGFLYNFAHFIDWPEQVFTDDQAVLKLSILGENPFGDKLKYLHEKTVGGRGFEISYIQRIEELKDCHILFISNSELDNLDRVLAALNRAPVLTIGDMVNFTRQGGMINFLPERGKIRFAINPTAAKWAGLTISSKLLRLAVIISEQDEEIN